MAERLSGTHLGVMRQSTTSSSESATSPTNAPYVLALGDSLTAGFGLLQHEGFAARLEAMLQERWAEAMVENAGRSGDTTGDALARLPAVLTRLSRRPDLAIVELGANDVLRGVPPQRTEANLDAIVHELGRSGIRVLVATIPVPPSLGAFAQAYSVIPEAVAAKHGTATSAFFPPAVLGRPGYVLADRVHPNARAIELCARSMLPAVIDCLRSGGMS